jgi:hypothetical protein
VINDQKIYTLMLKAASIRAVQIADALDEELVDVSSALKTLVDVGDVVRTPGTAPNGQTAQFYSLSSDFRKSRECMRLEAQLAAQATPPAAEPTSAPMNEPTTQAPAALPTSAPTTDAEPMSKVARAIAFLNERRRATTVELRQVMGLKTFEAPSAYLKCALKDGRIKREGDNYELGGEPPAARTPRPAFGGSLVLPGSKQYSSQDKAPAPAAEIPQALVTQTLATLNGGTALEPAPVATQMPSASASAAFRCGLWIDDVVELQRGGITLDKLDRDEAVVLRDFLNRVLP